MLRNCLIFIFTQFLTVIYVKVDMDIGVLVSIGNECISNIFWKIIIFSKMFTMRRHPLVDFGIDQYRSYLIYKVEMILRSSIFFNLVKATKKYLLNND